MTISEARALLYAHNRWRRGDESIAMHEPARIGRAIDVLLGAFDPDDVVAVYGGTDGRRDWVTQGAWLRPGQALAVVRIEPGTKP